MGKGKKEGEKKEKGKEEKKKKEAKGKTKEKYQKKDGKKRKEVPKEMNEGTSIVVGKEVDVIIEAESGEKQANSSFTLRFGTIIPIEEENDVVGGLFDPNAHTSGLGERIFLSEAVPIASDVISIVVSEVVSEEIPMCEKEMDKATNKEVEKIAHNVALELAQENTEKETQHEVATIPRRLDEKFEEPCSVGPEKQLYVTEESILRRRGEEEKSLRKKQIGKKWSAAMTKNKSIGWRGSAATAPDRTSSTSMLEMVEMSAFTVQEDSSVKLRRLLFEMVASDSSALLREFLAREAHRLEPRCFVRDSDGATLLHAAARRGDSDILRAVLACGAVDLNARSKTGGTALMIAAQSGGEEAVRLLLEHGASAQVAVETTGVTALMLAAQEGHLKTLRLLCEEGGADVRDETSRGISALEMAARRGHLECGRLLLDRGASGMDKALEAALQNGKREFSEMLLDIGAKVTRREQQEDTIVSPRKSLWASLSPKKSKKNGKNESLITFLKTSDKNEVAKTDAKKKGKEEREGEGTEEKNNNFKEDKKKKKKKNAEFEAFQLLAGESQKHDDNDNDTVKKGRKKKKPEEKRSELEGLRSWVEEKKEKDEIGKRRDVKTTDVNPKSVRAIKEMSRASIFEHMFDVQQQESVGSLEAMLLLVEQLQQSHSEEKRDLLEKLRKAECTAETWRAVCVRLQEKTLQ
jgi:hypothetical protein